MLYNFAHLCYDSAGFTRLGSKKFRKGKTTMKKTLAIVLALAMVLCMIPAAFAASALVRHTRRACSAFSLRGVNISPLSIGVFCGFLAVIEPHKVRKIHCYAPPLAASAVEYGG